MATKDEFIQSLEAVRQRALALRDDILAGSETPLLDGHTWNVRDALCHLAARSHLSMMVERVERMAAGNPITLPAGFNPEDVNQAQIDEREGRSVESLLEEIISEHEAAIALVPSLDDSLLARMIPTPRGGGEVLVSDLLVRGTAGHDNVHFDDIQKALSAKAVAS